MESEPRFFENVNLAESEEDIIFQLRLGDGCALQFDESEDGGLEAGLHIEDRLLLRAAARHESPKVRAAAVHFLTELDEPDWDGFEQWLDDSDHDVRSAAINGISSFWICFERIGQQDFPRLVPLLGKAVEQHHDYGAAIELCELALDHGCLDVTWQEANRLLSLDDPEVNTSLIACYFEHVITDLAWGPDDTHIAPWLTDGRAWVILEVADYWGTDKGRLADLLTAMSRNSDGKVAAAAALILKNAAVVR